MKKKPLLIHRDCGGGRGALNPLPLLPLKLKFVTDQMQYCGFSASNRLLCGAIAAFVGASRRKYYRKWIKPLGAGGGAGYGAGGGRMLPLILVVDLVILGLRKKIASKGLEVWLMLLPLITRGLLCEAPRKSTTVNTMEC